MLPQRASHARLVLPAGAQFVDDRADDGLADPSGEKPGNDVVPDQPAEILAIRVVPLEPLGHFLWIEQVPFPAEGIGSALQQLPIRFPPPALGLERR